MDDGDEPELGHPRDVGENPSAIERDTLETGVEADARQAELVLYAIELSQTRFSVSRLDDADRRGKPIRPGIAVARDRVVLGAGVGDPVRAGSRPGMTAARSTSASSMMRSRSSTSRKRYASMS